MISLPQACESLDAVNFTFLILGILLHWTPASFIKAAIEAGNYIWGVVIQFPFYAGMFGIIRDSGLAQVIANWFTSIASAKTYPLIIYWYSGILNYFSGPSRSWASPRPSSGTSWATPFVFFLIYVVVTSLAFLLLAPILL